jgi:predicted transcriptional regulator of viral defense system
MATNLQKFLRKNPVFSYTAFAQAASKNHEYNRNTVNALLAHHILKGHIVRIRRRLFAAIPVGADPKTYPINPFLIAGYAAPDAVVSYRSALSFYQKAYSTSYRFIYQTKHQSSSFNFRTENYAAMNFPEILVEKHKENIFTNLEDVQGLNVRVTNLERTLVDVLDKPHLGGGWEEIWRSLSMINRIKIDQVIEYVFLLNNATTIAKVGFYLSQRQKELKISSEILNKLHARCPRSPHYIDKIARINGKFINNWNIIVPQGLITKEWQE